ncbi:MAG: DUF2238 domain-containing protein [Proteobacteria bacterium]|nr:DUF2238 domain-containing protein [Pseudomonadota bacterium]
MYLRKDQIPILVINLLLLILFTFIFMIRKNYEFLFYVCEVAFFLLLIVASNSKVKYPNYILWGLTAWVAMHLSGGGLYFDGTKLYEIMLISISDTYMILKYDQVVHAFGFAVATLVMYQLIRGQLKEGERAWFSISIVVVMAGLGAGALNEIVEFFTTVIVPDTGVGGYVNNSLDLVFNLIGAICAMVFIRLKEGNGNRPCPGS